MADSAWRDSFLAFAERKTREADRADLSPLQTPQNGTRWADSVEIGNDWTRRYFDGAFVLPPLPAGRPAVSLVFVQSRDGNTGARDPSRLGGGDVDKHVIYEGVSRVAAGAVMAGAATAAARETFYSVWRRELVDLRSTLGLPRHPLQIVVSADGNLDVEGGLLFNVPDVRVLVLAGAACRDRCGALFGSRPWISVVPIAGGDWRGALTRVCQDHGVARISAIGGRRTATSLIDAGMVQDICLTTTGATAGEPDTPFYTGARPPTLELIVRKQLETGKNPILFEHLAVGTPAGD